MALGGGITLLLLGVMVSKSRRRAVVSPFNDVVKPLRIRNDAGGSGVFGASRADHTHEGLDFSTTKGQLVLAPFAGTVVRKAYPIPGNTIWQGLLLRSDDGIWETKFFYCEPFASVIGKQVKRGEAIGKMQGISARYKGVTDHLHVEVRKNGALVDPAPYFRVA